MLSGSLCIWCTDSSTVEILTPLWQQPWKKAKHVMTARDYKETEREGLWNMWSEFRASTCKMQQIWYQETRGQIQFKIPATSKLRPDWHQGTPGGGGGECGRRNW